jgi:hypothetical protein
MPRSVVLSSHCSPAKATPIQFGSTFQAGDGATFSSTRYVLELLTFHVEILIATRNTLRMPSTTLLQSPRGTFQSLHGRKVISTRNGHSSTGRRPAPRSLISSPSLLISREPRP